MQNMTIEQLKEIAKTHKIKSLGNKSKNELIDALSKNL